MISAAFPCPAHEHIDFAAIQWPVTLFVAFFVTFFVTGRFSVWKQRVHVYSTILTFLSIPSIETDLGSLHVYIIL